MTSRLEDITRGAAAAIKMDVTACEWWETIRGLVHCDGKDEVFSPLANPGDAFMVEDALHMSVHYKSMGHGAFTLRVSCPEHGGAIMHAVSQGESTLNARMYAITQFAALCAIMNDEVCDA